MSLLLFGARSPLIVDYEETAGRLAVPYFIVALDDRPPRALNRRCVRTLSQLGGGEVAAAPYIACAFVPARRRVLVGVATENGLTPADALIDPTAVPARSTRVGAGSYINAGAILGGASRIGTHVVINRGSTVGHHCRIDDFASLGPGVTLASNIHIGEGAVIGAGATVLPDLKIGAEAIVAAGSVVRGNVPKATFVAGAPAREKPYDVAASIFAGTEEE